VITSIFRPQSTNCS